MPAQMIQQQAAIRNSRYHRQQLINLTDLFFLEEAEQVSIVIRMVVVTTLNLEKYNCGDTKAQPHHVRCMDTIPYFLRQNITQVLV
jgi:hypothetical protein